MQEFKYQYFMYQISSKKKKFHGHVFKKKKNNLLKNARIKVLYYFIYQISSEKNKLYVHVFEKLFFKSIYKVLNHNRCTK